MSRKRRRAIADWLKTDPTESNDPDFLIIGDLNADIKEDPLTAFANAGFINLAEESRDAASYSYIYRAILRPGRLRSLCRK